MSVTLAKVLVSLHEHEVTLDDPRSSDSLLLSLPAALQREVLSWCPDAATAYALLRTCRALRGLRFDPTAAALLLLRCDIPAYKHALDACKACQGGVRAVVHQVLQLVQAGLVSGVPHPAPPLLLHHMLIASASCGDDAAVGSWLTLPNPPNVNASNGAAFEAALTTLTGGPHLAVLSSLLEHGADPSTSPGRILSWASNAPAYAPALRLLLRHYATALTATAEVVSDTQSAMRRAITFNNSEAVEALLSAMARANPPYDMVPFAKQAAQEGCHKALSQLVGDPNVAASLPELLLEAVRCCRPQCAEVLLEHGVGANNDGSGATGAFGLPLLVAVKAAMRASGRTKQLRMVRLLRNHGAVVTPAVQAAAAAAMARADGTDAIWPLTARRCRAVAALLQPEDTSGPDAGPSEADQRHADSVGCGWHKCVIA